MTRFQTAAATILALLSVLAGGAPAVASPIVVELFQSQGCSSCPPANANLATVADRPDVIALNFSVTYWDDLGWKDTFARPAYTARQWDYAHGLRHGNVFTPQVVVDGRRDGDGIAPADFTRLVWQKTAMTASPNLTLTPTAVSISAGDDRAGRADVWLVRYDPRTLNVPIRAGENTGKTLPHRNIVRELIRIGHWTGAAETLRLPPPGDPIWRTAILVQVAKGGPILAAAKS